MFKKISFFLLLLAVNAAGAALPQWQGEKLNTAVPVRLKKNFAEQSAAPHRLQARQFTAAFKT